VSNFSPDRLVDLIDHNEITVVEGDLLGDRSRPARTCGCSRWSAAKRPTSSAARRASLTASTIRNE
jgi:hypothetical protein